MSELQGELEKTRSAFENAIKREVLSSPELPDRWGKECKLVTRQAELLRKVMVKLRGELKEAKTKAVSSTGRRSPAPLTEDKWTGPREKEKGRPDSSLPAGDAGVYGQWRSSGHGVR